MADEKITAVTRGFKQALQTKVGSGLEVKISPSSQALQEGSLAVLPCLILQGPEIQEMTDGGKDFTIDSTYKETVGGVKKNTEVKAKTWINLLFRVRLFHKRQHLALDWVTKLIRIANELTEITVGGADYNIYMDSVFDPDTVPNFSDLKHYESSAKIEDLYIQTGTEEDVWEIKTPTKVDMYKKEG